MKERKRQSKGVENEKEVLKQVSFRVSDPEAQNVSLAGNFNDWDKNSHSLEKDFDGNWKIHIDLMPGRYEYRFLVDGEWRNDPDCTSFAPNPFGSENCILKLE